MAWTRPERWGNDDLFSGSTLPSAALILPEVCERPDNAGESALLKGSLPGAPRSRWSDQKPELQEEENRGSGLRHSRAQRQKNTANYCKIKILKPGQIY